MSHLFNSTGYPVYASDIVRGRGCYVYDATGKRYLDLEAGVWALPLGHCDPEVTQAMHSQIDTIMHVGYAYNQPVAEQCAEKLLSLSGMGEGQCVFLTSGSEAVEYGVQLAAAVRPGRKLACLRGQYLSAYGLCREQAPGAWQSIDWDAHERRSADDWYLALKTKIDFSRIGVFVFEPGNSSGLVRLPPRDLVAALERIVKEYDIVTVVDEVTCGIGRTGKWFGFMHYDLRPDIVAAGKSLGNGYPVSAVIIGGRTIREAEKTGFHFAQSHQNDPMGCRVAYAVVTKIERDGLPDRARALGETFRAHCARLGREVPVIREIRGIGLMNCIALDETVSPETMRAIGRGLFDRGMIAGVKPKERVIRTYCPLIITTDMIDEYIRALKDVLLNVA